MWTDFLKMLGKNWSRNIITGAICASVFVLAACGSKSAGVPESFINAYVELRCKTAQYGETHAEARVARIEILKKYGYTRESFNEMAETIRFDYKRWKPFQDAIVVKLDSLVLKKNESK